jgi:hypothetical protein
VTEALETHLLPQIEHSRRFFWHRLRWRVVREYPRETQFDLVDVRAGADLLGSSLVDDGTQTTYCFVEPFESIRVFLRLNYGDDADPTDAADFNQAQFGRLLNVLEHQGHRRTGTSFVVAATLKG